MNKAVKVYILGKSNGGIKEATEKDRWLSASHGLRIIQQKHKEGMHQTPFKTLARWS